MTDAEIEPQEPDWLSTPCPGGQPWSCCMADDCGVAEDGTGCEWATRRFRGRDAYDEWAERMTPYDES